MVSLWHTYLCQLCFTNYITVLLGRILTGKAHILINAGHWTSHIRNSVALARYRYEQPLLCSSNTTYPGSVVVSPLKSTRVGLSPLCYPCHPMLSGPSLAGQKAVHAGASTELCYAIQALQKACRASFCSDPLGNLGIDQSQGEPSWNRTDTDLATVKGLKSGNAMTPAFQAKNVRAQGLDRMPTRIQLDITMASALGGHLLVLMMFCQLLKTKTSPYGKYGCLWGAANEDHDMASRQGHACVGKVQQSS